VEISFPPDFFSADEEAALRDDRLTRFSTSFSGSVFPESVTSFGFTVVPTGLLARLGDELGAGQRVTATVEVSVFGDLDGSDVESVPFIYPVTVCNGCMIINNGDCANLGEGFEGSEGGTCNVLQDVPVDCCTSGDGLVCPVP
jgi:hypothetical protein